MNMHSRELSADHIINLYELMSCHDLKNISLDDIHQDHIRLRGTYITDNEYKKWENFFPVCLDNIRDNIKTCTILELKAISDYEVEFDNDRSWPSSIYWDIRKITIP